MLELKKFYDYLYNKYNINKNTFISIEIEPYSYKVIFSNYIINGKKIVNFLGETSFEKKWIIKKLDQEDKEKYLLIIKGVKKC